MDADQIVARLFSAEGMTDPYPLYAALHEHSGAVAAGPGFVLVPGYEAANAVLRDPVFLVDDAAQFDRTTPGWRDHPALSTDGLLNLNGSDHARVRALMARQFTHRRVRELEPAIAVLAARLLDAMAEHAAAGEPADFMTGFAFALPVAVIAELIGVADWDPPRLRTLARRLTAILEPVGAEAALPEADAASVELAGLFTELAAARRAEPRGDLVSALAVAADQEAARLSEAQLVENLILLLIAGFETTTNLLGNGLHVRLTQPAVHQALTSGEVTAPAFVEEVLRYDSPVQMTGRRAAERATVGGATVTPEDQLVVMLGAANRDPRQFPEPDAFLPGRTGGPLSFGAGAHFCLGAALARLEGTVAFPMLLRRFPALALDGLPVRRPGLTFRGFERLPVTLG